jgi:uncharacterized protein
LYFATLDLEEIMTLSMYQASVPVFIRMLNNLIGILEKGAAYAEAKKIDPSVLVTARLYPNMFPLSRQVQIASDQAKGCAARLSGQQPPKYDDTETTFPELITRVKKTIDYLNAFKPEQIDGSEDKSITVPIGKEETMTVKGMVYLLNNTLPNVCFHITTAYGILRHNGVEIGKKDYLGKFS